MRISVRRPADRFLRKDPDRCARPRSPDRLGWHEPPRRRARIRVRWQRDQEITVRETPFGPVASVAPFLRAPPGREPALHWIGHTPNDEMPVLLRLNRARNWTEFRLALNDFAISAQGMSYADTQGHVSQAMAAKLPQRPIAPPTDRLAPPEARHQTRRHGAFHRRRIPHNMDLVAPEPSE